MKRLLCVLLAVIMLCPAFAEAREFDRTKLEGKEGYLSGTSEWWFVVSEQIETTAYTVKVKIYLDHEDEAGEYGPQLQISLYDKTTDSYYWVKAFRVTIGNQIFCFEKFTQIMKNSDAYTHGGIVFEAFCNALIDCEEVEFEIDYAESSRGQLNRLKIKGIPAVLLVDLKHAAELLNESNAWSINPFHEWSIELNGESIKVKK